MAFLAFPGCIQATVRFSTGPGGLAEVSLWYRKWSSAVEQSDVNLVAETIDDVVGESWLGRMNSDWTYVETYARDMTSQISYQATANVETGPGTRSGSTVPACIAHQVQRESGFIGRSARGRVFLPFGVAGDYANLTAWSSTFCTGNEIVLETTDTAVSVAGDFLPIIASRELMEQTSDVALSTFVIQSWRTPTTKFAVVRGRLRPG